MLYIIILSDEVVYFSSGVEKRKKKGEMLVA